MAYSKEERRHRNRQAAKLSRERQRSAFAALQERVAELEVENARLRAGRRTSRRTPSPPPFSTRRVKSETDPSVGPPAMPASNVGSTELPPWYSQPATSSPYEDDMDLPPTPPTGRRSHAFATPPPDAVNEALSHTARPGGISSQMRMLRIPSTDSAASASTSSSIDEPTSPSEDSQMEGEPEILLPECDGSPGLLSGSLHRATTTPDTLPKLKLRFKRPPRTFSSRLASVHAQITNMNRMIIELVEDRDESTYSSDEDNMSDLEAGVPADDPAWSEGQAQSRHTFPLHTSTLDPHTHLRAPCDRPILEPEEPRRRMSLPPTTRTS